MALFPLFLGIDNAHAQTNTISVTVSEGQLLEIYPSKGFAIEGIVFASYGTPNNYVIGDCHAVDSLSIVQSAVKNGTLSISADNGVFGDPCGGTYKQLSVIVSLIQIESTPVEIVPLTLNNPTNLSMLIDSVNKSITLSWLAPETSTALVERYAISWKTADTNGWGIATGNVGDSNALNTNITISLSTINQDGLDKEYTFYIRADNDSLGVYSGWSNIVSVFIPDFERIAAEKATIDDKIAADKATADALLAEQEAARLAEKQELARLDAIKAEQDRIAAELAEQKAEADRLAAETAAKIQEEKNRLAIIAAQKAEQERIAAELAAQKAEEERILAELEKAKAEEDARLAEEERLKAEEEARIQAEKDAQAEADRIKAEQETAEKAEEDRLIEEQKAKDEADRIAQEEANAKAEAEAEEKAEADRLAEEERIAQEKADQEAEAKAEKAEEDSRIAEEEKLKEAAKEGKLSEEQKDIVADKLIEQALSSGQAITAQQIQQSGIEYKDLPPTTPVDVRTDENGNTVIITAEVAAQVELLQDPGALLETAFSDPGAALQALGSIGADMSDEEREEATDMVVATVVAAGAAINAAGVAAAGSTGSSGGSGGGSSGGGSGSNSPGSRGGRRW